MFPADFIDITALKSFMRQTALMGFSIRLEKMAGLANTKGVRSVRDLEFSQ